MTTTSDFSQKTSRLAANKGIAAVVMVHPQVGPGTLEAALADPHKAASAGSLALFPVLVAAMHVLYESGEPEVRVIYPGVTILAVREARGTIAVAAVQGHPVAKSLWRMLRASPREARC